jgi:hypothetical protein
VRLSQVLERSQVVTGKPAKTIQDALRLCRVDEPLPPGDWRYEDFAEIRGLKLEKAMGRQLEGLAAGERYAHLLLAGHRGCGKSTELCRLQHWAEGQGYATIYAEVNTLLADTEEVEYSDLLLLEARLIEEHFRQHGWPLEAKTLQNMLDWFKDITKVTEKEVEASVGVGIETGVGLPMIAKFLLAFTSGLKAARSDTTTIKESIQRYPDVLVQYLNLLLDSAHKTLHEQKKRGLLIILDNLDRYPQDAVEEVLFTRSDLLKRINCHVIYSIPISLVYGTKAGNIWDSFDGEILPMVKVHERSSEECEQGIQALVRALGHRLDIPTLFAEPGLTRELALKSGGCLRDLIHLVHEALVMSDHAVDDVALQRSILKIRSERSRQIMEDDYSLLAQIHLRKTAATSERLRALLYRRDVLEYNHNEERWLDVHPLVLDMREFQDALIEERRKLGLA